MIEEKENLDLLEEEAHQIKEIFETPVFRKYVNRFDSVLVENWKTAKTTEEREHIWLKRTLMMELLNEIKQPLVTWQMLQLRKNQQ